MNAVLNEDDENLAEILLLESIILDDGSHFESNYEANNESPDTVENRADALEDNTDDKLAERNIENCSRMLELNKQITSSLTDLRRDITFALAKCEQKLKAIECSLETHTVGNKKILIYNAGMPYFKDKRYFSACNNDDETSKENCRELQLKNLPKISAWTRKERDTLLNAVTKEIERQKEENTRFSSIDALEETGPSHEKEYNWFRISSVYFEQVHSPFDCCVMWNVYLRPDINRKRWTKSENIRLRKIAKKHHYQDWDTIAKELNTNRTAYQCLIRYNTTKKLPKVQCTWKDEEDKRLLKLVGIFQIGDFIPWGGITNWMRSRTKQQVYFRWSYSLAPYLTKGRFTKTEDDILKDAVAKYGTNFHKISAMLMPNRSTVQLHDRYQTLIVNQNQKRNSWTFEEDTKLLKLFKSVGPNWSMIAKQFSGKTRTYLRHRYKALQKYIKRGVSVFKLHGYYYDDEQYSENETEQVFCTSKFHSGVANKDCDNDIDIDIDQKLIEYFHIKRKAKESDRTKFYNTERLECNAISLYNILQVLDAKLCTSSDISRELNNRNQQLLHSLREYGETKNDKKKYFEIVEKYKSRMFGTGELAQHSSFIPTRSSDSQRKLKNLNNCIDYNLNKKDRFIFQAPIDFNTPEIVISHIGGDEQESQFQKFSRSFQISGVSKCETDSALKTRNCATFSTKRLSKQCRANNSSDKNNSTDKIWGKVESVVCSDNGAVAPLENGDNYDPRRATSRSECENTKNEICIRNNRRASILRDDLEDYLSSDYDTDVIIQKRNVPTQMYVSHATLLSFKNLTYVKRLNERYHRIPNKYFMRSKESQEAFNLLETRLEKLLKYPLGLSKVSLPEVYVGHEPEVQLCLKKRKESESVSDTLIRHKTNK